MATEGPLVCYRELIPATNVHMSTFFNSFGINHLFVCSISTVTIYRVQKDSNCKSQLVLCLQSSLYGKVRDVRTIKTTYGDNIVVGEMSRNESVFMAFDIGKFVIVSYEPIINQLVTVAMFNAEENGFGLGSEIHASSGGIVSSSEPFVDCDELSGLICGVVYSEQLFFIPRNSVDKTFSAPFVVDILNQLLLPGAIVDMCFVSGYHEPTLAILQASECLPVGHAAQVLHTSTLTVLAISIPCKSAAVLWQKRQLPHDSLRLVRLTDPHMCGGVAVISMNAVLVVTDCTTCGIAMNGFASTTVHASTPLQTTAGLLPSGLELDASRWIECDHCCLVGNLKSGELVAIQVVISGSDTVRFEVDPIARSVSNCSTFAVSADRSLWFLGSRQADGLLIQVSIQWPSIEDVVCSLTQHGSQTSFIDATPTDLFQSATSTPSSALLLGPLQKKSRRSNRFSTPAKDILPSSAPLNTSDCTSAIETEEELLYGETLPPSDIPPVWKCGGRIITLEVVDSVPVLGPINSGIFTSSNGEDIFDTISKLEWSNAAKDGVKESMHPASSVPNAHARDTLMFSTGLEGDGALTRVSMGLRLSKLADLELADAINILPCRISGCSYSLLLASLPSKTRVFRVEVDSVGASAKEHEEVSLHEMDAMELGLAAAERTIAFGAVHAASRVVAQVSPRGVRVMRLPSRLIPQEHIVSDVEEVEELEALQDMQLTDSEEVGGLGGAHDESVILADICEGWTMLWTSSLKLYVLKYEVCEDSLSLVHSGQAHQDSDELKAENLHINSASNGIVTEGRVEPQPTEGDSMCIDPPSTLDRYLSTLLSSARFYRGHFPTASNQIKSPDNFSANKVADLPSSYSPRSIERTNGLFPPVTPTTASASAVSGPVGGLTETQQSAAIAAEEIFMYGLTLAADQLILPVESLEANGCIVNRHLENSVSSQKSLYLILSDARGTVTAVQLENLSQAWTVDLSAATDSIQFSKHCNKIHNPDQYSRVLCDVYIDSLVSSTPVDESDSFPEDRALTLVCLFDSGDSIVYHYLSDKTSEWVKIESTVVTHRPRYKPLKQRNGIHSGGWTTPYSPGAGSHHGWNNIDLNFEDLYSYRLSSTNSIGPFNGILIPGPRPAAVVSFKGRPSILPVNLPELPPANAGSYILTSLLINNDLPLLVTLWQEDAIDAPAQLRSLGLYAQASNPTYYPAAIASTTKIEVNTTINFCAELCQNTDEKTEQVLLHKKTHVLACSDVVKKPFAPTVLTEEEAKIEEENYDRFFFDLSSFCQPDETLAPAPLLEDSQHKLVITQEGSVVDEYLLRDNEQVLGLEVMYLKTERLVEPKQTILQMLAPGFVRPQPIRTVIRRVFIAVSTLVADKHGEDTQGEGRVMLFSLGYKHLIDKDKEKPEVDSGSQEVREAQTIAATIAPAPTPMISLEMLTASVAGLLPPEDEARRLNQFLESIQPKFQLHWSGPGPASVVKQLGEYLLTTVAYCVYIYKMHPETLEVDQVAFYYAQFYVSSVTVINNYIVLVDVNHSIQFLVWREADMSLTLLAKDYGSHICLSTGLLIDGNRLGMLVADIYSNLQLYQFNPRKVESLDGSRLLSLADFHLGSDVRVLLPHTTLCLPISTEYAPSRRHPRTGAALPPLAAFGSTLEKECLGTNNKVCLVAGTVDGGVGVLIPVDEKTHRTLSLLQQIMAIGMPSTCGLNQRDYRLIKNVNRVMLERKKGVLDGTLLWRFPSLPAALQNDLAGVVGMTPDSVLECLVKLDTQIAFF